MATSEKETFGRLIEEIWPRMRKKHLYPEVPIPVVQAEERSGAGGSGEETEIIGLELKQKQMVINASFLRRMKEWLPEADTLEALLDHGLSHYSFCPWDFHHYVLLYREARKVMGDKEQAKKVAGYFIDVVADTYCVKHRETSIPELYRFLKRDRVGEVMSSLCRRIWGTDDAGWKLKKDREEEAILRRLARIPYLDRSRWTESVRRFARTVKPLVLAEEEENQKKGQGKGGTNPLGEHDLHSYSNEEVDQGLRDFARETLNLTEFRQVMEDFGQELKDAGYGAERGMGRGAGAPMDADLLFYMKLAENYAIPLYKMPYEKKGTLHPHAHIPWEAGSPIQDIDPWTSFGRILPGITQVWRRKEGAGRGRVQATPDCLIVIDSSGSMINPRKSLSYAVLGAASATDAYLRNQAKVAVYNFSDAPMGGREVLPFSRRREDVYRVLCRYFGGGTALLLDDVLPLIRGRKNLDLFVITDMKITNLETLIGFFGRVQNRVTVVHIGENPYTSRFASALGRNRNISIFTVVRKEDIPRIVIGRIRDFFRAGPGA
jgi:hypothetical protein